MKKLLSVFLITIFSTLTFAQTTAIPDPNFEQALINLGYDTWPIDGSVLTANINSITYLDVSNKNISNITGIEDFVALSILKCQNNLIVTLDLSQNTNLTYVLAFNNQLTNINLFQNIALANIDITNNQLTNIDVTQNTALYRLRCAANQLTSIDVSQNTNLLELDLSSNQLTSLNISQNTILTNFKCRQNQISNLDVTQNTDLTKLDFGSNPINNIDISQNSLLSYLYCFNTQITNLNLSQHINLAELSCLGTQITSLNLAQNPALTFVDCRNTLLNCLNIKNGNNSSITTFLANNNPNLTCIEVDNSLWSDTNWTNIDIGVSFNTNCNNACSIIPCNISANYTMLDNGNGNYTFTNTSIGNFNQTHWAFGDGNTSTLPNPNHTFSANGTYVVVLTTNDSTSSSCMDYFLDTIIVTGVASPLQCVAGFVMYPDTTINNVIVVNSSTGTNLTYLWDFGDGDTSTLQFPSHTYATSGPYYLCLTINDGASCVDMYCDSIGENGVVFSKQTGFTINVIAPPLTTQVKEHATLTSNVAIYPNPNNGSFEFAINAPFQETNLTIFDVTGKVIVQQKITQNNTQLNLLSHPKGMYFYQLLVDGKQVTGKLIVQ